MVVKYPSELHEAERYQRLIRSNDDWRSYFASKYFEERLPKRIYTTHGTVFYVNESSGELRHGPLSESPANVFFVVEDSGGRIVHSSSVSCSGVICNSDYSKSIGYLRSDERSCAPTVFERVPISSGFALDQTLMTNNLVGLKAGQHYLSAEPDGRVTLNRMHCYMWEHFRLVPDTKGLVGAAVSQDTGSALPHGSLRRDRRRPE
jgi:hypothetical protein